MDVRFLLLLVCFCTLFFPSPGLILQRDSYGISVHARRPLSLGSRQVLTIKAQGDKEQPENKVHKHDTASKNNIAPSDKEPIAPAIQCGESQCEDSKKLVSACLRIPGDGGAQLFVKNSGDSEVDVKVVAPDYLTANPPKVSVLTGKSEMIQFLLNPMFDSSMLDLEAVKNNNITVITSSGDCKIALPLEYLRSLAPEPKPRVSSYLTPRAVAYLGALVLVVAVMGTWLCYKCYRKKRGGAVKYQQLEMIVPGQITPKERKEQSPGAWDEDWDDDWEDAEAAKSSSRLSQNLSSRNLGARRGNKDGWDNSWED